MEQPIPAPALESGYLQSSARVSSDTYDQPEWDYPIVEAWHSVTHPGGFRFCSEQPCHAIHYHRSRRTG